MIPDRALLRAHARTWPLEAPYDPDADLRRAARAGAAVLAREDPRYPEMLTTLSDAPPVLYVRGTLPLAGSAVAVVGSRRPSPYGLRMARRLASECASAGIPVVSGLARGIDSEAHRAALERGGLTWAVLGSGLDRIYPSENAGLADAIAASGGAVVTAVPFGGPPVKGNFPRRNRVLSGLSCAVVVVEGDLGSGSLITARAALDQGREVFAVPGPADSPLSAGPNHLLGQGARMACGLQDLLQESALLRQQAAGAPASPVSGEDPGRGDTFEEQKVLKLLGPHVLGLDDLLRATGWETPRLLRVLAAMEAKDRVAPVPGQRYARI